ncbi:neutral/alkaline non-lysosomal ceramidase [Apiospora hydei]|uniref:Neutral ceramidase n=1 Tax=Apiospora hydei TaxID=1337664 RepID=A0ABR1WNC7_9PEZI
MTGSYRQQSPRAPRRTVLAFLSVFTLLLLGLFAVTNFNAAGQRHLKARQAADNIRSTTETRAQATGDKYLLGVGKADITGPVVEINFAGYASLPQVGSGLRQRLYSRAFIVGDAGKPSDRFVYLVLDTQGGDTAVRYGILEGLAALGEEYAVYGQSNVAVTATHSHSGPGAWFNYLLPQITSLGFSKQSYQAVVDGAVLSIKRAHESMQEVSILRIQYNPNYSLGTVDIDDGNLSRSLYAYLANPESERSKYSADVDKEMTVLKFKRASDSKNIGVLTWYAVHGTSMLENNTHVSGDNKGVAATMFEKAMKDDASAAPGFVAGFSQANVGDTTPNVLGAYCDDGSGAMCSFENSTCADGKSQSCHGRGPLFESVDLGVSSCYEMGRRQYAGARSAYDSLASSGTPVVGSTVNIMSSLWTMGAWYKHALPRWATLFAAGTTDGPGAADFTQNDPGAPDASPLWAIVKGILKEPTPKQKACQQPKPVLLDVGELSTPYAWSPNIVDMQMLRVGQFIIIVSPSEATTMSGRRWRDAVKNAAASDFLQDTEPVVVLGGPANTYAHYLATPEEYGIQRYEGASTLFGQWQLPAYINLTVSNIEYLAPTATGAPPPGPSPPDNRANSLSLISGVVNDNTPIGKKFGDCTTQPSPSYARGAVVNATFVGANPRNNLRLEGTFAAIENKDGNGWVQVRDDSDWDLVYTWTRTDWLLGYSDVVISWETGLNAEPGTYRTRYFGDAKALLGGDITAFEGASNTFTIT